MSEDAVPSWRVFIDPGVCLVGLLLGLYLERGVSRGDPLHKFAIAVYVVSYLAGGWHATWAALQDLLKGKANIDFLMVVAAVGSAVLGEWWEGAVLLFLFSLSHALEAFILGRTRRWARRTASSSGSAWRT